MVRFLNWSCWFCLVLLLPAVVFAGRNISTIDNYAWMENAGWVNFRSDNGGVIVHKNYLSGDAWAENVGWILLGADGGGPYDNTNATNWGVNHDGSGTLSGYAWSETVGWIHFNPDFAQVTMDPDTGIFDGYAWSGNIGWIHFKNNNPSYRVAWVTPVATGGEFSVAEDGEAKSGSLAIQDMDEDDPTFSIVQQPVKGQLVLENTTTGVFNYTPNPNVFGEDSFTYKANDGIADSNVATVTITIHPVNDPPEINDPPTLMKILDQETQEGTPTAAIQVTIDDVETDAEALILTATASNTTLVPNENIDLGGSGSHRTITLTPATNQSGTVEITVTVNDGEATTTDSFILTVDTDNDPPTLSIIDDQTTDEDTPTVAIGFTIGDEETAVTDLNVSVFSHDTNLVPDANIQLEGVGANRTLTMTPVANQFGEAIIRVVVDDGTTSTNRQFSLTIRPVNDAPEITAQNTLKTLEETARVITLADLTVVDVDNTYPTDFTLTVQDGTNYTHDGNIVIPTAGFNGILIVPVIVNDGTIDSHPFNLNIAVSVVQAITIISPTDGTVGNTLNWIEGTTTASDDEITQVELKITDGNSYFKQLGSGDIVITPILSWMVADRLEGDDGDFSEWIYYNSGKGKLELQAGKTYTITARATSLAGSTESTSVAFTYTDKPVVTGIVLDSHEDPVTEAIITFTHMDGTSATAISNGFGFYNKPLEMLWNGTVHVSKPGYTFLPEQPSLNLANQLAPQMDFTGTALTSEQDARAIIIAGGDLEDNLWSATNANANLAYRTLLARKMDKNNIHYFSHDTEQDSDNDGLAGNDVETVPSLTSIEKTLQALADGQEVNDVRPLYLYLINHGKKGKIYLSKPSDGTEETLQATQLDTWLDTLQQKTGAKVVLIYDACYAGSFLAPLKASEGQSRIIIASSGEREKAFFAGIEGNQSFSNVFWHQVFKGASVLEGFERARDFMVFFRQNAWMDDDGDGVWHKKEDGDLAEKTWLGNPGYLADTLPVITETSRNAFIEEGGQTKLWVKTQQEHTDLDRVWAVVMAPGVGEEDGTSDPITDLPILMMAYNESEKRFEAVFDGANTDFSATGRYMVSFSVAAKGEDHLLSMPVTTQIQHGKDAFEPDDGMTQAQVIVVDNDQSQWHTIHQFGDEDWVKFYVLAEELYEIRVENVGDRLDPVLELYDASGTLVQTVDRSRDGKEEGLSWTATSDGVYFVRVKSYGDNQFGEDAGYELRIFRPDAGLIGFVTGTVFGENQSPIAMAQIRTEGRGSALSLPQGSYLMAHRAGTYALTATADGYQPFSSNVTVSELGIATLNIPMTPIVMDVNDPPTITSGTTGSIIENAAISTVVYRTVATDQDISDTLTYSLSGTDAKFFAIDATSGEVTLRDPADFEAKSSYSIDVIATDNGTGNLVTTQAVTIRVIADKGQEVKGRLMDSSGANINRAWVDSVFDSATTLADGTFTLTLPTSDNASSDTFGIRIWPEWCDPTDSGFETCNANKVAFVGGVVVPADAGDYTLSSDEKNGIRFKTDGSDWPDHEDGLVVTAPSGVTMTGLVTDGTQGIPHVWVNAWSHTTLTGNGAHTDLDGNFSIHVEPPPSGTDMAYYEVNIWTPDFVAPKPVLVKIEADGVTGVYEIKAEDFRLNRGPHGSKPGNPMDETANPTIHFTLSQGNTITGRVINDDGQGLPWVWVDIHDRSLTKFFGASTDENGFYEAKVEPGRYVAVVWGNGENLRTTWYGQATNEKDAERIDVTSESAENISFRMSSGASIRGTITGGNSGDVFINVWSEHTKSWGGQEVTLDVSGTTLFTLSGLREAKDYRLAWHSDHYMSGFYGGTLAGEATGPVNWHKATRINTTHGNVSGVNISLSSGKTLALTVMGMQEGEKLDASVWSDTLNLGGWEKSRADSRGIATLIIKGLDASGTDYRLFVNSSSGKYKVGNFKGIPVTTTDNDLSDGDSTTTNAGSLVGWNQATLISMADNVSVTVAMDRGGSISGIVSGLSSGQVAWVEAFSERTHGWGGTEVVAGDDDTVDYVLKGLKRAKDYRVSLSSGDGVKGGFYSGGATLTHWENAVQVDIKTIPDDKENGDASGIDLAVSDGVSISGSVLGLQANEWAWVDAWSDSTFSWAGTTVEADTETNGAGVPYQLDGLASASDYEVSLDAEGYVPQHKEGVDATKSVADSDFTLSTGGKMSGSIRGLNVAAFVWLDAFSPTKGAWGGVGAISDSSGKAIYTMDGLSSASDYVVALQTEGRTFFYKEDGITPVRHQHSEVTVTSGKTTEGIDFNMTSAASMVFKLSGTVVLSPENDDQVVEIMAWSADGAGAQLSKIGGGNFTLKGLPSGNYTVEVYADGYVPQRTKTVVVSSGDIDENTLAWTRRWDDVGTVAITEDTSGLNATLSTGFTLSGMVKDSTGTTRSGVWVNAWDNDNATGSGAATNSSGHYRMKGLPSGTYTVEVWTSSGKASQSQVLMEDTTLDLDIIKALGGIRGTVVNSSQIAKQGAMVLIFDRNGRQVAATATDTNGVFTVEGLTPNQTYTVKVFGDDNFSTEFSYQEKMGVDVTESMNAVGTLELTAPATSSGYLPGTTK